MTTCKAAKWRARFGSGRSQPASTERFTHGFSRSPASWDSIASGPSCTGAVATVAALAGVSPEQLTKAQLNTGRDQLIAATHQLYPDHPVRTRPLTTEVAWRRGEVVALLMSRSIRIVTFWRVRPGLKIALSAKPPACLTKAAARHPRPAAVSPTSMPASDPLSQRPRSATSTSRDSVVDFQPAAQVTSPLLTPPVRAAGHLHSCREPLNCGKRTSTATNRRYGLPWAQCSALLPDAVMHQPTKSASIDITTTDLWERHEVPRTSRAMG